MMESFAAYMDEALGLRVSYERWDVSRVMPLFLSRAASYYRCECSGVRFVAAVPVGGETLPELKRIVYQTQRYTDLPVVLASSDINPRQRRALTAQGVPFVAPGRQAYLPFLGLAATAEARRRSYAGVLTARGQAALVSIVAHPDMRSARELREITGMGASTVSRAVDELAQLGLIERGKEGRDVVFACDREGNALLRHAMPHLASPVVGSVFAQRDPGLESLPDAGETALASRSMLAPPPIAQKAVAKPALPSVAYEEVLEGELPDRETVELQLWRYDPLVAGLGEIDSVSLGASLMHLGDERVSIELDTLFGEEGLWP